MTDSKVCSCCGQTLPPARPKDLQLPAGYAVIFDRVYRAGKHGIHRQQLFDYIYGADPNGGPDTGLNTLRSRICYLNRRLRKYGLEISSPGYTSHYAVREAWRA